MNRLLRIFAAVLWLAWFAAIAPLHRRGIVTIDGADSASAHLSPCCMHLPDSPAKSGNPHDHSTPAERCAICLTTTVAGIDAPLTIPRLAPAATREIVNDALVPPASTARVDDAHCRGPPAV